MYKQKSNLLKKNIAYMTAFLIAGLVGGLNSSVYGAAEVDNQMFTSDFETPDLIVGH